MKVFWTLIKNNFYITIAKKPISFIIITLLPIIVLVACSKLINYNTTYINVGVCDNDKTYTSKFIAGLLKGVDGVTTYQINSNEIESNFRDNTINIAVELDKGFEASLIQGKVTGITIHENAGSNIYVMVSSILKNRILSIRNLGRATGGDSKKFYAAMNKYIVNTSIVQKEAVNDLYANYNNSILFIGFLIMLIFFKASSVANKINVDRDNNVYSRIFVANVKAWQYYGSNVVCNIAVAIIQVLVSVLGIVYLVNMSIGIRPLDLFLILSIISVVAVSFGTLCVAVTKDVDSASITSTLCILIFVLLGGSFIQVQYFPDIINKLSYISPVRWAISCVLTLQGGASMSDILGNIGVMAAMIAAFLSVSFYVIDKRDKSFMSLKS